MSDVQQGGSPPADGSLTPPAPAGDVFSAGSTGSAGSTAPWTAVSEGTGTATTGTTDTADMAKEQAGQVAEDAKQSAQQLAGTAMDESKQVLAEGRRQVRDLTAQAAQQVDEQSRVQKDKATSSLRDLAEELQAIATGAGGQSGIATDLAQQAAGRVHEVAGWVESRNPGELVDELRGMARRRPGAFLLGAVAAGVVAGRLTRGAVDAARSDDSPSVDTTTAGTPPYAVPDPTLSRPDVDLTTPAAVVPVEGPGSDLYAATDDPLYSGTALGGTR